MPEDNGKQNTDESYLNKYQKHDACSYGNILVWVDDRLSKSFKSYLGEDAVFDTSLLIVWLKKVLYWYYEKHFNKELVMTKKVN